MASTLAVWVVGTAEGKPAVPVLLVDIADVGFGYIQQERRSPEFLALGDAPVLTGDDDRPFGKNQRVAAVAAGKVAPLMA